MSLADLSPEDVATLREARERLETPGIFVRITRYAGEQIDAGLHRLPESTQIKIAETTKVALEWAMDATFGTLDPRQRPPASLWSHRLMVATTGAIGGAIGLISLPVELPLTTGIMFRSIADIARANGEDLNDPETRFACLTVFGLSPTKAALDPLRAEQESGYYAMIFAFAKGVVEGIEHTAQKVLVVQGSPAVVHYVTLAAERYGLTVAERAAAMAVPAVGALGGIVINSLFIYEFQEIALGHFAVRRLERKYGRPTVQAAYESLSGEAATATFGAHALSGA